MPTRYEVTNLDIRPLGFPEAGKAKETVIPRGATKVLTVESSIGNLLEQMAKPRGEKRPQIELSNLGDVAALDHDGDKKIGGGRAATPKPAPGTTPTPPAAENGGLDFDKLEDDQLRAYLAGNDVQFHPNTGRTKLLAKAKEFEANAAKEAAAAAKKGGDNADPAEAV